MLVFIQRVFLAPPGIADRINVQSNEGSVYVGKQHYASVSISQPFLKAGMKIFLIFGDLFHFIPRAFSVPGDTHGTLFLLSGWLCHM